MKSPHLGLPLIICLFTGLYALYHIYSKNDSLTDLHQVYQEHIDKPHIKEASPLIIQSESGLEDIFSHIPEMDWVITGKEQYSVPEYFRTHYTD